MHGDAGREGVGLGVHVVDLDSEECVSMLADYIRKNPEIWNEDIGED